MLNSLYGRLGMNPYLPKHLIVNEGEHLKLMEKYKIIDIYPLMNGKELIYIKIIMTLLGYYNNHTIVNIAIAAAVTAGARVYMSTFKNMEDIILYYSIQIVLILIDL